MAKASIPLTQKRLKHLLDYNPETGVFTWRDCPDRSPRVNNRVRGTIAGNVEPGRYVRICVDYVQYYAHRLAWFYVHGVWPKIDTDHENLKKSDNRLVNLREATKSQNLMNRKRRADNTSGFKGVSWDHTGENWAARIHRDHKTIYLGGFATKEEAHAAYCRAAEEFHRDYARPE